MLLIYLYLSSFSGEAVKSATPPPEFLAMECDAGSGRRTLLGEAAALRPARPGRRGKSPSAVNKTPRKVQGISPHFPYAVDCKFAYALLQPPLPTLHPVLRGGNLMLSHFTMRIKHGIIKFTAGAGFPVV